GETDDDEVDQATAGEYYGGKWGVWLRAPDLWFDLLDEFGDRFTPLGEIAEVRFGVKSGKDSFFFPIDHTTEALKTEEDPVRFRHAYGVPREVVESGDVRLVRCGEERGEIRPLETKFLEPEVHSLMEVDGFTVAPEDCGRQIVLIGKSREALEGTYAGQYVAWGEEKKVHQGATCAARETEERAWYDLTGHERSVILWPKERQYRHIAPTNPHQVVANCRLYEIHPSEEYGDADLWGGMLNSSWVLLSSLQYGRPVGNEGNWSTMVVDVNMMRVPDPRRADGDVLARVQEAFRRLKDRKALQFLSARRMREMAWRQAGKEAELEKLSDLCELDMTDRRELDDAVLAMLGVASAKRRKEMIDALYRYLREFFERTRQKEEKAILNKNKARRRGKTDPAELAAQIYQELAEDHGDFLRRYDPDFLDKMRPFDTYEIPAEGVPVPYRDMFVPHSVRFIKGKKTQIALLRTQSPVQDDLIVLICRSGLRGLVRVPHEENECRRVLGAYESFIGKRETLLRRLIEERSADEDLQRMIYDALLPLVLSGRKEEKKQDL
ncbi:MAG: SAM-dependent methyltransferase, partial [Syntrophaceae bacterium]|nr:SAM-dependent methyltransferase [Syntrophaceae bacterium]